MVALKSYLIRAVRDWAVDNGHTPHVVVDASFQGCKVPSNYVNDGRIVLNIHPRAVVDFELGDEWMRFSARFGSQSLSVEVPVMAVVAVYARENGQGISFPEKDARSDAAKAKAAAAMPDRPPRKRPILRLVK